jgi:hypothetical protein
MPPTNGEPERPSSAAYRADVSLVSCMNSGGRPLLICRIVSSVIWVNTYKTSSCILLLKDFIMLYDCLNSFSVMYIFYQLDLKCVIPFILYIMLENTETTTNFIYFVLKISYDNIVSKKKTRKKGTSTDFSCTKTLKENYKLNSTSPRPDSVIYYTHRTS